MLPYLTFLLGLSIGLLPILRRSLDSIRWAALSGWAAKQGIETDELAEDEMIGMLEGYAPTAQKPRLRRAK
jgi:hypothetical protein